MTPRPDPPNLLDRLESLAFAAGGVGGGFLGYLAGRWLGGHVVGELRALTIVFVTCVGAGGGAFLGIWLLSRARRSDPAEADYDDHPDPPERK
ncbi:MAG TPA: hypothetical protein VM597_10270 [Gemmataceae bacterium]|nr:hypothetical protein [Gemmataceae bacterium]